jgi:hypothetical protein
MEVSFHSVNSNKFAKILEKLAKVRIHQFGNKNPGLDKPLHPQVKFNGRWPTGLSPAH